MDVKTAIEKRRSVRKYQEDKEVSDADIIEIVEAGRTAPSWKNLQPWRFIIVRSQELREEVADCLIHPNPAKKSVKTASALIVPVSYTHLRAHETDSYLVCRLLLETKKKTNAHTINITTQ